MSKKQTIEMRDESSACCDPPCRLMQIKAMSREDLIEALVNAEEELALVRGLLMIHEPSSDGSRPMSDSFDRDARQRAKEALDRWDKDVRPGGTE